MDELKNTAILYYNELKNLTIHKKELNELNTTISAIEKKLLHDYKKYLTSRCGDNIPEQFTLFILIDGNVLIVKVDSVQLASNVLGIDPWKGGIDE